MSDLERVLRELARLAERLRQVEERNRKAAGRSGTGGRAAASRRPIGDDRPQRRD